jgi:hypothetical protein
MGALGVKAQGKIGVKDRTGRHLDSICALSEIVFGISGDHNATHSNDSKISAQLLTQVP